MNIFDNPLLSMTVLLLTQPIFWIVLGVALLPYAVSAILRRMRKGWN